MGAFIGNASTKVLHKKGKRKDACRASEIEGKNRKDFASLETAKVAGFRLCRICFPAENQ